MGQNPNGWYMLCPHGYWYWYAWHFHKRKMPWDKQTPFVCEKCEAYKLTRMTSAVNVEGSSVENQEIALNAIHVGE